MQLKQEKSELRRVLKKMRAELASDGYSGIAGKNAVDRITALDEFIAADTVLTFYPVGNEIDVLKIFKVSQSLGKDVAFPCSLDDGKLIFRKVNDLSELGAMFHNIPEPTIASPEVIDLKNSVCIVPALAFDVNGYRIGYGGGYYDRFLSSYTGTAIGVAYDGMIVDTLPCDEFDLPVGIIITERRILRPCLKK